MWFVIVAVISIVVCIALPFIGIHIEKKGFNKGVCPRCGKEFTTSCSYTKFCSIECRTAYHVDKNRLKKKVYNRVCPICGKHFTTTDKRKIS